MKNNNSIKIIILGMLIISSLFLINKELIKKNENLDINKKINSVWKDSHGTASKIYIYYLNNDLMYKKEMINEELGNYELVGTYDCYVNECKVYDANSNEKELIIKDKDYVIYNYEKNKYKKINVSNTQYNEVSFLSDDNKNYGILISNTDNIYALYSLSQNKLTTEFKYTSILKDQNKALNLGNVIVTISDDNGNNKYQLLNYETGKILLSTDNYIGISGNENSIYYYENSDDFNEGKVKLYNYKYELLFDGNLVNSYGISKSGNLAVKDKKETFSIYNKDGNHIKTSKKYKSVEIIMNNYVATIDDDNYLKVVDYDGNVEAKFEIMKDELYLDSKLSKIDIVDDKEIIYLGIINKVTNDKTMHYYVPSTKEKGILKVD